ncbi:hypothetical protein CLV92_12328 [Kineococcus xinjiangensis]|uniref:HEAT repeat protein n=1 Tax=Kineococcus xinjiangensis TaxID=512762 RepID=A0A2S6IC82_9ACTN|nr:hypothetical protein CLV92_12328 [Kineococcus xinjiangensis]
MPLDCCDDHEQYRRDKVADIQGQDVIAATDALLELALNDPDRAFVEDLLVRVLEQPGAVDVRALAVTCLGHTARIHGAIGHHRVLPLLAGLRNDLDPDVACRVDDALGDIEMFAPPSSGSESG